MLFLKNECNPNNPPDWIRKTRVVGVVCAVLICFSIVDACIGLIRNSLLYVVLCSLIMASLLFMKWSVVHGKCVWIVMYSLLVLCVLVYSGACLYVSYWLVKKSCIATACIALCFMLCIDAQLCAIWCLRKHSVDNKSKS